MRQRLLLFFAIAVISAACGSASIGPGTVPSPTPTPSPTSPLDYAVVLTQADHSATLRVGQKLEVALRAASGMTNWTHPTSSDESVLAPTVDPAATAMRGVTLAAFIAKAPGQATIRSAAGPLCSPGQPCPMYAVEFTAVVTVTG